MAVETVRIEGLAGVMKTLEQLGPAASVRGGPVRVALRKAALIIQKQEVENVNAIILEPNVDGLPSKSTGLLAKNIVASRGKKPIGEKGETFVVRIRNKAYPVEKGKRVTTAQVGRLLEYGTEKMQPHPFIRPAFDSKKQEAVDVFVRELPAAIVKLQKKLARQNGVKE